MYSGADACRVPKWETQQVPKWNYTSAKMGNTLELLRDVRYSTRRLRRQLGLTTLILVALSLSVGLTTLMFAILDGVVVRSDSLSNFRRLALIRESFPQGEGSTSYPNFLDWQRLNHSFAAIAAYSEDSQVLRQRDRSDEVTVLEASSRFFSVLQSDFILGRPFEPDEDQHGKGGVAVLTSVVWDELFHRDPAIVGKHIVLGGIPRTVIGVLGDKFQFMGSESYSNSVIVPLEPPPALLTARNNHAYEVIGRLKAGVSIQAAESDMKVIGRQLELQYPQEQANRSIVIHPMNYFIVAFLEPVLTALFAAVLFVLVIACANVAGLQIARVNSRTAQIAICQALGASRMRLLRQWISDSFLLAFCSAALGLIFAYVGLHFLLSLPIMQQLPRGDQIAINGSVVGFTMIVSICVGVFLTVIGGIQSLSLNLGNSIRVGEARIAGPGTVASRARRLLVVMQVGLAMVLLVSMGLLVKMIVHLSSIHSGFVADHVMTMQITIPEKTVKANQTTTMIWKPLLTKLKSMPEFSSVGLISRLPLQETASNGTFYIVGRPKADPAHAPFAEMRTVGGDFYSALHVRLLRGRLFDEQDYSSPELAIIINDALADKYFAGQDPIGQRIMITDQQSAPIVGVVEGTRQSSLMSSPDPEIDYALSVIPDYEGDTVMSLVTEGRTESTESVIAAVHSIDPDLAISHVQSMQDVVSASLAPQKLNVLLISIFGGIAAVLAFIGLYTLLTITFAARTAEIGLRMALGAQRKQVLQLVFGNALKLIGAGLLVGTVITLMATRLLSAMLYGFITTFDAATWLAVIAGILVAGLLAALFPALHAANVQPVRALRQN